MELRSLDHRVEQRDRPDALGHCCRDFEADRAADVVHDQVLTRLNQVMVRGSCHFPHPTAPRAMQSGVIAMAGAARHAYVLPGLGNVPASPVGRPRAVLADLDMVM
jgi:hypothetical protein